MARHPVVVLFPDLLTDGGPFDDWRRLAGFVEGVKCVRACVSDYVSVSVCLHVFICASVCCMRGFTSDPLSL